jgi:hypothetical protein
MIAVEFWCRIFQAAYATPDAAVADPSLITAHYSRFFRGYQGPCRVTWTAVGSTWSFTKCPHGGETDICDAHQGFVVGLLQASVGREVRLADNGLREGGCCKLVFDWEHE